MQILSVALTNFKTHKEQQFQFELGTNAICGENGAGKTSILEAIAWVLFNYQGSYRKEDLIRNGASSAQARVAFVSSRDSRTYEVQRSTTTGYAIYDPQLAEKLPFTRTKDEVLPWLRQHLGVAPGTDLGQLFANTIGVPQGTFTADFLLSTEKRKPIFDTILKVEEYRETYKQSNSLRRYAEAQVQRLKDLIEQYEESLQGWDELKNRRQQLQLEITKGTDHLAYLEQQAKALEQQRQAIIGQAEQVQQAQTQQTLLTNQLETQQQAVGRLENALTGARQATEICKAQQGAHGRFLAAEQQLKELGKTQKQRQQVLQQQQQTQQSLANSQSKLSRLEAQREQFATAEKELEEIAKHVTEQLQLEAERTALQKQVQTFANLRFQQKTITQRSQQITQDIQQIEAELKRLSGLQVVSDRIPKWEQQQTRIQEQLSRLAAAQQFEQELKVLSETGQARQDGYRQQVVAALATLDDWVKRFEGLEEKEIGPIREALFEGGLLSKETLKMINSILADLGTQTDPKQLRSQQKTLKKQLQEAYAQRAELTGIAAQEKRRSQLAAQQSTLQKQLSDLQKQLATEGESDVALKQLDTKLKALDNPKGKQQLLEKTLQKKAQVEQQYKSLETTRIAGVQQLDAIATQLQTFEQLDQQLQQQEQLRQTHQPGYLLYLQNQQAAAQTHQLTADHKSASETLTATRKQIETLNQQLKKLTANFEPNAFAAIDKQYTDINSEANRLRGSLPQLQQRFADLDKQITTLKATADKRDQATTDLKQRERIKRFVNFARKVYKTAGPRITERYVQQVSREADRLFRELLGRANVALTWSADYEIVVQEGAHTRRFVNLSGGEQMCAALAVRLALLKVLADIDVAFFDEPTTNMDRPRRAGLAEAISRIKSFNQLFVISHDDTFEQVTETVITVERQI
ncbi:MAG: SMC family ATPase [Cyanobacteria bacterium J06634_6]